MPLVVCNSDSLEECLHGFVGHRVSLAEMIVVMAQADEIVFSAFRRTCEPSRNHTPFIFFGDRLSLRIQGAGKPFHPTLIPLLWSIFQGHCRRITNLPLLNDIAPILHIRDHNARNRKLRAVGWALGFCHQAIDTGVA